MKKTTKLGLKRQTLKPLTTSHLRQVVAGLMPQSHSACGGDCVEYTEVCTLDCQHPHD